MASNTMKYYALVAWANVCKWGWWTWRKVVDHWSAMPDRCRVYACIMFVIVLLSVSIKAFANHVDEPIMDGSVRYFHLNSVTGPIACEPTPDSDGLHICWPYALTDEGPVFGNHGWCFAESDPFTEAARWGCSGEREEALNMKGETLDEEVI